jgi:tRNA threonylcarbamoyl adenosine modification protein YeaZ
LGFVLVLAFDTATPAVTAALHDGTRTLAEHTAVDARRHGELLSPAIAAVLAEAGARPSDVTAIVAGAGPGPYTGLRVGLMTAQALSAVTGAPAHGICTLDALAYATGHAGPFLVATDARRKEVFWAAYDDLRTRRTGPSVDVPAALPGGLPIAGAGGRIYAEIVGPERLIGPEYPSAGALATLAAERLAAGVPLGPARPIYLRRPDARVPGPAE